MIDHSRHAVQRHRPGAAEIDEGVIENRQMDFQERMAGSQYQRGMRDMRKAGLNPLLAYKQGGAASPAGAAGSGAAASGVLVFFPPVFEEGLIFFLRAAGPATSRSAPRAGAAAAE